MGEPNIVMSRIDNRLVHGQVGVSWLTHLGANLLLVADDEAAGDETQQAIMTMTARQYGVQIRFFTLEKTAAVIHKAAPEQKIFIIARTPVEMLYLIEHGVPIKEVNIGNMHFGEGKRQLSAHNYADEAEIEALKKIREKTGALFMQELPTSPRENFEL
ncbi:MAG: PTS N-acetylgalactosamine transporter subunit IIB [Clostridiales Family XIII bacterium]|jgi:PTS system galactosamine-specific IIB component|nr:PTS N-acetylgalactosamine transporter subunit IIB [Clostridiales Family XIII bacterium]